MPGPGRQRAKERQEGGGTGGVSKQVTCRDVGRDWAQALHTRNAHSMHVAHTKLQAHAAGSPFHIRKYTQRPHNWTASVRTHREQVEVVGLCSWVYTAVVRHWLLRAAAGKDAAACKQSGSAPSGRARGKHGLCALGTTQTLKHRPPDLQRSCHPTSCCCRHLAPTVCVLHSVLNGALPAERPNKVRASQWHKR